MNSEKGLRPLQHTAVVAILRNVEGKHQQERDIVVPEVQSRHDLPAFVDAVVYRIPVDIQFLGGVADIFCVLQIAQKGAAQFGVMGPVIGLQRLNIRQTKRIQIRMIGNPIQQANHQVVIVKGQRTASPQHPDGP